MTKTEAIQFVQAQINARGMSAGQPETEGTAFVIRVKHGDHFCGSVTVSDAEVSTGDESALTTKVFDALRAAVREPVLKVAI